MEDSPTLQGQQEESLENCSQHLREKIKDTGKKQTNLEPGAGQVTSVTPTYRAAALTTQGQLDEEMTRSGQSQLWVQEEAPVPV